METVIAGAMVTFGLYMLCTDVCDHLRRIEKAIIEAGKRKRD